MHGRISALQGLYVSPADLGEVIVEHPSEISGCLAGKLLDLDVIGEGCGVGEHRLEVLVVRDDVETCLGHPIDRCLLAQLLVVGERAGLNSRVQQCSLNLSGGHRTPSIVGDCS